jgi:hypothetical protein
VPPCVLIITASASAFFSECFGKCLSECSIHIAIAIVIFVTHKQKGRCTATPFQSASYRDKFLLPGAGFFAAFLGTRQLAHGLLNIGRQG